MNHFNRGVLFVSMLLASGAADAAEDTDRARERKAERLEGELGALRRDLASKQKEVSAATRELNRAKAELADAERREQELLRTIPANRARDPAEEDRLSALKQEAKLAALKRDAALAEIASLKDDQASLKGDVEQKEDALDRAELVRAPGAHASPDCPDGSCAGGRKGPPNQTNRSDWENVAEILKAITPLGLGAMSTYVNYQGMKQQSSDYRFYNASNTALGLPSAAPTSYGTGFNGVSFGGTAAYGGAFAGYNPYAVNYGSSYAMPYSSPYASSYGTSYTASYATSYASNYGTGYAAYDPNTVAAQTRAAQQAAIFSSDALLAQQSLLGGYSSYNQVMQSVSAAGTVPYGSYLNYNSNGGYGGITTLYNPAAVTSTALNSVRR